MGKYIPLSPLVAEIKKLFERAGNSLGEYRDGAEHTLISIKDFLDTLEVKEKEVDLEDSIKETLAQKYIDYTCKRHNIDPESKEGQLIYYAYMHGMNQCLNQLKAQKGE